MQGSRSRDDEVERRKKIIFGSRYISVLSIVIIHLSIYLFIYHLFEFDYLFIQ